MLLWVGFYQLWKIVSFCNTNHAQAPAHQQYIARLYKYHAEIHFESLVPAPSEKHTQKREEMKIYVLR